MSKAFTLEKSQKKKKKMLFVYGMYARLFYCLWHMGTSLQFIQNSNPTLQGPTTPIRDR